MTPPPPPHWKNGESKPMAAKQEAIYVEPEGSREASDINHALAFRAHTVRIG